MSRPPGALAQHTWTWPIDVSRYDRTADLTAAESATLDRLAYRTQGLWPRRAYTELDRLLRPLHDAMDVVGLAGAARRSALRPMVVAMARTGRAFWGWSDDDWCAVLRPRSRRQRLLAFRYLLCGFARPGDLPVWYDRYGFATRIFGQPPVDAAVGRVTAVLLGWGYRERNLAAVVRMPLCEALLRNRSPRLEDLTPEALDAALGGSAPERYRLGIALAGRALLHLGLIERPPAAAPAVDRLLTPSTPAVRLPRLSCVTRRTARHRADQDLINSRSSRSRRCSGRRCGSSRRPCVGSKRRWSGGQVDAATTGSHRTD